MHTIDPLIEVISTKWVRTVGLSLAQVGQLDRHADETDWLKMSGEPSTRGLTARSPSTGRPHVIAYRATLGVPRNRCSSLPSCCGPSVGDADPAGQLGADLLWQAMVGLRWFGDRTTAGALARDPGISWATAYRYLDEVVAVLVPGPGSAPGQINNSVCIPLPLVGQSEWRTY
jgi:hypothetical protein